MTTPKAAIIRCKTLEEARQWLAAIPAGCAVLTGNNVQIIKPVEVSFAPTPAQRSIPLSDGPSLFRS